MNKLAIFGGKQEIPDRYQNYKIPYINFNDASILKTLNDASMITYDGKGIFYKVESEFSSLFGTKYTLSTNSGTNALFSMYYAAGLTEDDEVLVPGYTFFATATPLFLLGCKPILVDCCENGNIDPEDIKNKITSRTKAIVVTHLWGIPCEMDVICKITQDNNLLLFEDYSHAHGATYDGRIVGNFGDGAACSLGAQKLITGGQGGMFTTSHKSFFYNALLIGHFNKRALTQIKDKSIYPYAYTGTGLNLRMHPFAAAIITEQIKTYPEKLAQRREVAEFMKREISNIPGLSIPFIPSKANPAWYTFPVLYDEQQCNGIRKEKFIKALQAEGCKDIDVPDSTCPISYYHTFSSGFTGTQLYNILEVSNDIELPACNIYHHKVFKMPVWIGPERFEYAKLYINSIKKVIESIDSLLEYEVA